MTWLIKNEVYTDAWEAANAITDGNDTVNTVYRLEQMHDNEESTVNGYSVTSFHYYE